MSSTPSVLSETYLINETTKEKNLFSINTHFDVIEEVETDKNYSLNVFNPCEDEDIYKYDFLTLCSKKSLTSKVGDELRLLMLEEY